MRSAEARTAWLPPARRSGSWTFTAVRRR